MGQTPSRPAPGRKLQVIGAGMSRTGTTSFGVAIETLLNGPVYHGGTQLLLSPESHIKRWIDICEHTPEKNEADRKLVMEGLKKQLDGFVGCTDLPALAFVEELMEIYPDAKVVTTVRDPDKWWASMAPIVEHGNLTLLSWILTPVPTLRMFRRFHDAMDNGRFGQLYFRPGEPKQPGRVTYDRHIEHLKKIVPKEKLFFFDVRDGWEPLCKMLDCPVPDTPFPRLNDAKAMEEFMGWNVKKGLMGWAAILAMTATAGVVAARYAPTVLKMVKA